MNTHKKITSIVIFAIVSSLLVFASTFSQHETTATKIETIEGVTEYELSNGLRVVLLPDPSNKNITVNITYLVGSAHEGYGETGMAHLLEHLIFKGSTNHPDIPAELTEHGASPNGSTWLDRTNYYETFAATDENLDWALDLEADRMINCFISAEDLEPEMPVVRNEWEIGENNPFQVLFKRMRSVAFDWHNYGNSTIGAKSDIESVPIERLRGFYQKYYQPDNAVLFIAGKIDEERTIELVLEKFGPIPRPDRTGVMEIFPNYTAEAAQDGERTVVLERVGDFQIVRWSYHMPGIAHEDLTALSGLAYVLSGAGVNSRLYKSVVETELASGAFASAEQFKYPGLFNITATVPIGKSVEEVEAVFESEIQKLKDNAPAQEEVDRAMTSWSNSYKNAVNDVHGMVRSFTELAGNGDWRLFYVNRERSKTLTPEKVQMAAQKYLMPSNRTKGYFKPVDATPPRVAVEGSNAYELISKYEFEEDADVGEDFEFTYDNVANRTEFRTMSNGTRVAMVPKKNKGGTVSLSATMRWGTEETAMNKGYIAGFTGGMMSRGTTEFTKEELSDKRRELRLGGSVGVGLTSGSVNVSTVRENFVESIRLIAHTAKSPGFPEDEFDIMKTQSIESIEASRTDPSTLLSIAMGKHLYQYPKGHPFYVSDLDEDLEGITAVTLDDVKAFYNEVAGFGPNTTVTIVGDFDPDEIFTVLEEEFGDWVSEAPYKRIDRDAQSQPGKFIEIDTPDKTNAYLRATFDFASTDEDPDYEALTIAGRIFGGGFLNSRLATRIRQKEGLSYSVGGGFSGSNPIDKRRSMYGGATTNPETLDRLLTAFKEEVVKAVEEGFTDEEVQEALAGYLDAVKRSRANDGWIAGTLHHNMFWGRDMEFHKARDARYESLTTDAVNEAFRNRVSLDKFTIVVAADMALTKTADVETSEDMDTGGE